MCTNESSCGCAPAPTTADAAPPATGTRTTYTVAGMTCGGCAASVSRKLRAVAGVAGVEVDVASGAVTVTSDTTLETADVRSAVEQAGYRLVG